MPTLASLASPNYIDTVSVQTISTAYDLGEYYPVAVVMPSTWLTAQLSFQVSHDNVTFVDLYDSFGNEYIISVAANRAVLLPISDFIGFKYIKLRSGTSSAVVDQTTSRTLQLILLKK